MCYMRRKIEGAIGAMRESDDTNFLKPDGQSRNLYVYGIYLNKSQHGNNFWANIIYTVISKSFASSSA